MPALTIEEIARIGATSGVTSPYAGQLHGDGTRARGAEPLAAASPAAPGAADAYRLVTRVVDLKQAVLRFHDLPRPSPFAARRVVSTDPEAASGSARAGAELETFSLDIVQLAKPQQIRSDDLDPDERHTMGRGARAFSIETGGQRYAAAIAPLESFVTHGDLLAGIATAVERATQGRVIAELTIDNTSGLVALDLRAAGTGQKAAFRIREDDGPALLAPLGLTREGQADPHAGRGGLVAAAQNARLRVDGGDLVEIPENRIALRGGAVELTLHRETSEPVQVTVEPDVAAIAAAIREHLAPFSDLLSLILAPGEHRASALENQVSALLAPLGQLLRDVGIDLDAGAAHVDEDRLAEVIAAGRLDQVVALVADPSALVQALSDATRTALLPPSAAAISADPRSAPGRLIDLLA